MIGAILWLTVCSSSAGRILCWTKPQRVAGGPRAAVWSHLVAFSKWRDRSKTPAPRTRPASWAVKTSVEHPGGHARRRPSPPFWVARRASPSRAAIPARLNRTRASGGARLRCDSNRIKMNSSANRADALHRRPVSINNRSPFRCALPSRGLNEGLQVTCANDLSVLLFYPRSFVRFCKNLFRHRQRTVNPFIYFPRNAIKKGSEGNCWWWATSVQLRFMLVFFYYY